MGAGIRVDIGGEEVGGGCEGLAEVGGAGGRAVGRGGGGPPLHVQGYAYNIAVRA